MKELQRLLHPSEALIQFLDVAAVSPLPGETLVWVITRDTVIWRSVAQDTKALTETVMALRCGLDRKLWQDTAGAERCANASGPDVAAPSAARPAIRRCPCSCAL